MNQEEIGKLICGGFQGTYVTQQAHDLIVKYKVSTMILSRKNAQSVPQMTKLIRDLQHIAFKEAGYKHPLAFAVDEECGMMNSIFDPENLSQFPGAMALAATGDLDLVYEVSKALALQLRHIGFTIILGPVLDVVTKLSHQLVSVRSFGTTIDEVVKYGRACARGLRDGGLVTVGKHFPGIGNAKVDSLLELPMMTDSLEQIRRFNSIPFAELINEGLIDGISATGCGVPTISPDETHACLSPAIVTQLLRKDMGFEGFVVSECLEMDALYHSIGLGQGVVLAIYAGCNLVMVCHDFKLQVEAIESITSALDNGLLDESMVNDSLRRLDVVRRKLPSWEEIFPQGFENGAFLFREVYPDLWKEHQQLTEDAYRKSITLVRDYEGALPLSQYADGKDEDNNILVLTPLLKQVYPVSTEASVQTENLFPGEEVFREFGRALSSHQPESGSKFNILHTTYTANGLTALHESLIENSKAVIVVTSEASRNMYQIGIVKYVSILCGATPSSLSSTNNRVSLSKPLIILATSSPYDFFYNKGIGSAYLCCYDYTSQALTESANVIMGKYIPQGCVPGEKKFHSGKMRKRRSSMAASSPERISTKIRKTVPPKRRWLVDEFDMARDWRGLVNLFAANGRKIHSDEYLKSLISLLHASSSSQRHFVVRNSSLNILYGVVLTWVDDVNPLMGSESNQSNQIGNILYIMVDKAKRLQSIGKNLHSRAIRYLTEEKGCQSIRLGSSFPLLDFAEDASADLDTKVVSFFNNSGWVVSRSTRSTPAHVMVLKDLSNWSVPSKIFRELTIVGVRFDICSQADKLLSLIERATDKDTDRHTIQLYKQAVSFLDSSSPYEVKVIIALEPMKQCVIGSIILFNSKSSLARFYPFMHAKDDKKGQLVGGVVCPVIDPSYSNLTEIFKFGLICSGVTYLKSNFAEPTNETPMNSCIMVDVTDDKAISGVQDIGFERLGSYCEYYDELENVQ